MKGMVRGPGGRLDFLFLELFTKRCIINRGMIMDTQRRNDV